MRGVPRARRAISIAPSSDAEPVAPRRGEQPGAGGGADQRERGEIDLHRARGRALADDQVELEILHGGIEHFLHRRIEAVDLVDEQHVALFEIGQECREVARLGDDGAGGGLEVDAQLARHDLGERGLAQPRGPRTQHMVQRLAARLGSLDEDPEVLLGLRLADEFFQPLRTQMRVDGVVGRLFGFADRRVHASASSFSARRISFSVG